VWSVTEQEIRQIIIEALEFANVTAIRDIRKNILQVHEDVLFAQLDMDSLAVMELCIAIETRTGVSIVPEDLQRIDTLNRLTKTIKARLR
jgi:acyl carrier protein